MAGRVTYSRWCAAGRWSRVLTLEVGEMILWSRPETDGRVSKPRQGGLRARPRGISMSVSSAANGTTAPSRNRKQTHVRGNHIVCRGQDGMRRLQVHLVSEY
eukprot:4553464-Pyramimonas_sp.AAC.1